MYHSIRIGLLALLAALILGATPTFAYDDERDDDGYRSDRYERNDRQDRYDRRESGERRDHYDDDGGDARYDDRSGWGGQTRHHVGRYYLGGGTLAWAFDEDNLDKTATAYGLSLRAGQQLTPLLGWEVQLGAGGTDAVRPGSTFKRQFDGYGAALLRLGTDLSILHTYGLFGGAVVFSSIHQPAVGPSKDHSSAAYFAVGGGMELMLGRSFSVGVEQLLFGDAEFYVFSGTHLFIKQFF